MKALILKEWRENIKWSALAMLVIGGLTWLIMHEPPWPESIMHEGFLVVISLVSATFGAIVGFLQVFSESSGDRRALLLHRPLGRSQIFLAKTSAGLGVYLLAVSLPFACGVGWVAMPGHTPAPFRWPLVLPWLADILTGVVYYFAGMLTAQREARWYGSRGLPLVAAILCSLLVHCLPEFRYALLAIVVLVTLMAVAAWGSFQSAGAYTPQPRIAKAALAVTFLTGLLVVGDVALLIIGACFDSNVHRWYQLDRQGRVLSVRGEAGELRVTDLKGQVPEGLKDKAPDWHALEEVAAPLTGLGPFPELHSYRCYDRLFMPIPSRSPCAERWFYVSDQGRLLGYGKHSKRLIGSLGPDGFSPPDQQSGERFKGKLYYKSRYFLAAMASHDFLPFSDGVYRVDFAQRTIQPLFTPAPGQTILRAERREDEKQKLNLTFVLGKDAVRAVDEAGTLVFSTAVAFDPKNHALEATQLDNPQRFVIWYQPPRVEAGPLGAGKITLFFLSVFAFQFLPPVWDQDERGPSYVVEYDAGGDEIERQTVPPFPIAEPSYAQALYGLVTPPAGVMLYGVAYRSYFPAEGGLTHGLGNSRVLASMALMSLSALACALVCFLLARRYALSRARRIAWSLCGLLWGPAGLLLMLALVEWPARIACPKCRKLRVVTRDTCEHCGALHAAPASDGTEIFEPAATVPHVALTAS